MLNTLLGVFSNSLSKIIHSADITNLFLLDSRLRLVFYHGIGSEIRPCLAYLNDEISEDTFQRQIDYLQYNYNVCPLEEAINVVYSHDKKKEKPVCSITFDDGLASVYKKAFPLLKNRGLTAAVFLNTAVIDNKNILWLHLLNYLVFHKGLIVVRQIISDTLGNEFKIIEYDEKQFMKWCKNNYYILFRAKSIQRLINVLKVDVEEVAYTEALYLTTDEIKQMSMCGFTFYSHTENHLPLKTLPDEISRKEIDNALKYMDNNKIGSRKFVSFPFGMVKDYGEKAREYALSVGHEYVLEVGDGYNSFSRMRENKTYSRVSLGSCSSEPKELFSALEITPRLKAFINSFRSLFNDNR